MKKFHCKSTGFCKNCDEFLYYEAFSKKGETIQELEIRVLNELKKIQKNHSCPPSLKITTSFPTECDTCGEKFKNSSIFKGIFSTNERHIIEGDFVNKVSRIYKEHKIACKIKHTQTRTVLIEKNKNVKRKKRN